MQDELDPKTNEEGLTRRAVSRREFLKYAGIAGGAVVVGGGLGGLIAACGEEETTTTAAAETTTTAGGATTTTAAGATTTVTAGPEPPARTRSVIGAARPITGANAPRLRQATWAPPTSCGSRTVNAAGGIKVAGKKLPIEMTVYDDQSDLDQSMRLLTKLMRRGQGRLRLRAVQHRVPVRGGRRGERAQLHPDELRGRRHDARGGDGQGHPLPYSSRC